MNFLTALILGIVQGLTEFFPISSSAHLELTKRMLGLGETPIFFDLACHLGTLIALCWFLRSELFKVMSKKVLIALLPLLPGYLLLRHVHVGGEWLGFFLMLTGGILLLGERVQVQKDERGVRDLLVIGAMQTMAFFPGISRSASTISAARMMGWNPSDAVRFSFILAIPTVLGGVLVEGRSLFKAGELSFLLQSHCIVGFLAAFCVGMGVIRLAMNLLERGKLKGFAWYCLAVGALVALYTSL